MADVLRNNKRIKKAMKNRPAAPKGDWSFKKMTGGRGTPFEYTSEIRIPKNVINSGDKVPGGIVLPSPETTAQIHSRVLENIHGGRKGDIGKTNWDLMVWEVLEEVAEILTQGAAEYGTDNWKKVEPWRYRAALQRHYSDYKLRGPEDKKSGKGHMAHIICNAMFLRYMDKHPKG